MAGEDQEEFASEQDDNYYAFLNIPRDASQDDVSGAYRRLSRLYHPDKHSDPDKKKEAEVLFNKTKIAYEVLSDPHRRAIYDSLGVPGLRTEGWEVVQRTRTPQEIREEYQRLAREREERRLLQRTNPKGSVTLFINATDLFCSYDDDLDDDEFGSGSLFPLIEVGGMSFNQSIEAPLTVKDTATMSGQLSTSNGTGQGQVSCSVRRLLSERSWAEAEVGVGSGLMLSLRGFRSVGRHLHATGHGFVYILPNGLGRVGLMGTLGCQLDRHTVGYLTYRAGAPSGVQTMLVRETEHSRLSASLYVGLPHSYVTGSLLLKMPEADVKTRLVAKGGTFGFLVEYGVEKKISGLSTLGAFVSVGMPTGVAVKIKSASNQTYTAHVRLSDELMLSPVFYGTVVPLLAWAAVSRLLVAPYVRERQREEAERRRQANRDRTAARRREAESAVGLMRETVARIRQAEELRRGLIITAAWYGRLVQPSSGDQPEPSPDDLVDVTIPLQCLVKDSKLILQESPKSHLPGFFDPAPDTEKSLQVEYLFHGARHQTTVADTDPLRIPKSSHHTAPD
ncbi:dnaJ homolog subfamily C member 11-like [Pollicipes pollicipes]|uniref:dnaJ homolog subfamily C member 11-like n=1 Tax=Pollicipes pollicipes TaxID=41117 RepID=UPI001884F583|nr:dnaJ homolog subfamily C member 11-like [Pollicipes pollicipes]